MRRKHPRKVLEQFSLVEALVAGLFDGVFTLEEVSRAGTLGLGCGDHMDGELVLHGGMWRQFHGDGSVSVLDHADTVPFAEVVDFDPDRTELIEAVPDFEALASSVAALVPSANLFHAVRFEAHFASISLREAARQEKPYLPLAEAVHTQRENVLSDVTGTLLGFVAPQAFQGITVAGPHFHFVDETGRQGGHVLGLSGATGELSVETYFGVTVHLPASPEYLAAELDPEGADAAIRHAESDHQR